MNESVLIYASEPETVLPLVRTVDILKENGLYIHGIFKSDHKIPESITSKFDLYELIDRDNAESVIGSFRAKGNRMVVIFDIDDPFIFEKLLANLNVITVLYDLRYSVPFFSFSNGGACSSGKFLEPKRRGIRRLLNESDLIISFTGELLKKAVSRHYKGELIRFNYISENRDKMKPFIRKDKTVIFIPGVYSNEKTIISYVKAFSLFQNTIELQIDDRICEAVELRNYVLSHSYNSFVTFTDKTVPLRDHLILSDIVFIPDRQGYTYLNEIVDALSFGRPLMGFTGSIVEEYAPGHSYSLLVEPGNMDSLILAVNRILINSYLITKMGTECYNLHKVKYSRHDFMTEVMRILKEYNV